MSVKKGQKIKAGQKIGNVGSSGNSTAPHLHFEEKHNGIAKPVYFGSKKAYYYGSKNYKSSNQCTSKKETDTVKTKKDKSTHESQKSSSHTAQSKQTDSSFHCQDKNYSGKYPYYSNGFLEKNILDFYEFPLSPNLSASSCK